MKSSHCTQTGNRLYYKAITQQTKGLILFPLLSKCLWVCMCLLRQGHRMWPPRFQHLLNRPQSSCVCSGAIFGDSHFGKVSDLLLHSTEITQMLIASFICSRLSPTVDLLTGETNNSLSTDYFAQTILLFYWVDLIRAEDVRQFLSTA